MHLGQLFHKRCARVAIHAAGAAAKITSGFGDERQGSGNTAINLGEGERDQLCDRFNSDGRLLCDGCIRWWNCTTNTTTNRRIELRGKSKKLCDVNGRATDYKNTTISPNGVMI
jgi:hypothetical protein